MIDRLQNQLLYLNDKIENISNIPILKRQHTRSASKSQNVPVENKSNKRKSEDLDLTLPIPSKKQSTNSPLESSPSSDSSNQCSATPPTLHVNPSQLPAPAPIPPELNPNSSEQSAASTSNLAQLSVSSIQPASTLPPLEQPPASTITLLPSDQFTNSTSNPVQLPVSSTKPSSTSPTAASNIPPANPFRSSLPHIVDNLASPIDYGLKIVEGQKTLFISKLDPSTNALDVKNYIKTKIGTLRLTLVEKMIHRNFAKYSSFKIKVPDSIFYLLNSSSFWPEGIIFHEFQKRALPINHHHFQQHLTTPYLKQSSFKRY